jgi:hypothetical protein
MCAQCHCSVRDAGNISTCLARRYVTREDDMDSDKEEADDSRSDGEELLDVDYDTDIVSSDFDLMSLKTGSGRWDAGRRVFADVVVVLTGYMHGSAVCCTPVACGEWALHVQRVATSSSATSRPSEAACAAWVTHGAATAEPAQTAWTRDIAAAGH